MKTIRRQLCIMRVFNGFASIFSANFPINNFRVTALCVHIAFFERRTKKFNGRVKYFVQILFLRFSNRFLPCIVKNLELK